MTISPPFVGFEAADVAAEAVAAFGRPLIAVTDPVALAAVDARLPAWIDALAPDVVVDAGRGAGPASVAEVLALASHCVGAAGVVAVGGGRTLDAAKIACSGTPYLDLWFRERAGSDLVVAVGPTVPLLAVPTTVGTGCEVSAKAMLTTDAGRLLLIGESLRPTASWAVPEALDSLPAGALQVAGVEILGRLLGPWLGAGLPVPASLRAKAERVVDAVDTIVARSPVTPVGFYGHSSSGPGAARIRARRDLFAISASAHLDLPVPSGKPCSYWLWPLANEWSTLTGGPKMQGLLSLLPAWLGWVLEQPAAAGDGSWWLSTVQRWSPAGAPRDDTSGSTLDPDEVLDRVERHWRPIGPGLPPRPAIRRVLDNANTGRLAA